MRIHEIFFSIQGESTDAGLPTIFLRSADCNLSCDYCDTVAARVEGLDISLDELISRIHHIRCNRVMITGGEPLLQREEAVSLMEALLQEGYTVLLETNGSQDCRDLDERIIKIVDIKTPSSGMAHSFLWENLPSLYPHDNLKFVIGSRDDYEYARRVVEEHGLIGRCHVLFSPVHEKLSPGLLADWILHDQIDVRLQLQLHKIIWQDKDGIRL